MHGCYEANNIWIWHIKSHFLSPSMFVTHVNGHCVETCVNIKLSFFLHVPISLKNISFNIVGHGINMIVEVLLPCLRTLPICTFITMNLIRRNQWKSLWKTMGYWYVWVYETKWYLPQCGKKERSQLTFKFIHLHGKNACSNGWHNARKNQWSQRRWGSIHRPHHIIVACYCNRCTKHSPFQGEWSHAFQHGISLRQWWTW